MARLTKSQSRFIYEFILELGLVPKNLITPEIIKLIHQSWERQKVLENITPYQRKATQIYSQHLIRRNKRRLPQKILDNMQPLNFETLFDNI